MPVRSSYRDGSTSARPADGDLMVPTHAEALAIAQDNLAKARTRLHAARVHLRNVRSLGGDHQPALLAWNLANNEVDHRKQQLEWWERRLAEHPELAGVPILEREKDKAKAARGGARLRRLAS